MLTMFSGTKIAGLPPSVTASPPPHLRARGTSTQSVPTTDSTHTADSRERRRLEHHEADVVVVGAGIVGCAAAVAFGNQGRSVLLLEKSLKEPDRIVGELLQPGGVNALEKLGMSGASPSHVATNVVELTMARRLP
jgi:squalene monooxygenase